KNSVTVDEFCRRSCSNSICYLERKHKISFYAQIHAVTRRRKLSPPPLRGKSKRRHSTSSNPDHSHPGLAESSHNGTGKHPEHLGTTHKPTRPNKHPHRAASQTSPKRHDRAG